MDINCTLKGSSKRGEVKNGKEGILERERDRETNKLEENEWRRERNEGN